jgi:hypothetical protein
MLSAVAMARVHFNELLRMAALCAGLTDGRIVNRIAVLFTNVRVEI